MSTPKFETMECTLTSDGVAIIAYNRPAKANAISLQLYREWLDAMRWAANDKRVIVAVVTGKGKFFTGGAELLMPDPNAPKPTREMIIARTNITRQLVEEYIKFPKLLIGAANGPVLGIGCTTLSLCDVVYSVPDAYFKTPFMELGFCAEGCSSFLFSHIIGPARANEMILLGRQCSAEEFERWGFISRILPAENFMEQVMDIAKKAAALPPNAVLQTKNLIKLTMQKELMAANNREIDLLVERMLSDEHQNAVARFLTNKAAKKSKL
ncbi:ClpP/crotonase-like domain-containing protein [Cladochytrium replicatum]|nr:ClpP/crotonase-like domain-containing protein [Cladochytrium replicatum]